MRIAKVDEPAFKIWTSLTGGNLLRRYPVILVYSSLIAVEKVINVAG
jgi:hypothetical protein